MARWLELADGGSTRYSAGTRAAAVTAGGAMVLASLVAATAPATADEGIGIPSSLAGELSRSTAVPTANPSETRVAGLIVEYSGSSSRLGAAAGAASSLGHEAEVTYEAAGEGVITFAEATDVAEAEKAAARLERLPGVASVEDRKSTRLNSSHVRSSY